MIKIHKPTWYLLTIGILFLLPAAPSMGDEHQYDTSPGFLVASFFKTYISPVDGDRCPSVPTCSSYSLAAFKKHGFFIGWLMTVDRLIHEGRDEAAVSLSILSDGKLRYFDPVENNDFWWYRQESDHYR